MEQTTQLITKEMTISDVVKKYPQAVPVFLNYGLHCIGCHVSAFETVEQGASGHGMAPEKIDEMIKEANTRASESEKEEKNLDPNEPVRITSGAIKKVKELMEKEGKAESFFRIKVIPGGCSGMSYSFGIDEKQDDTDTLFEKEGLKVLLDKESFAFLKGAKIDYVEALEGAGFKIDNPNAKSTCGCGNSFA